MVFSKINFGCVVNISCEPF